MQIATQTMSSTELVSIINEVRNAEGKKPLLHKNFIAKIEKHPGIQSAKFLADYKDDQGRTYKCYQLPKRECELMVMSESLAVQTRVYLTPMPEINAIQKSGINQADLHRPVTANSSPGARKQGYLCRTLD